MPHFILQEAVRRIEDPALDLRLTVHNFEPLLVKQKVFEHYRSLTTLALFVGRISPSRCRAHAVSASTFSSA